MIVIAINVLPNENNLACAVLPSGFRTPAMAAPSTTPSAIVVASVNVRSTFTCPIVK